MQQLVWTTPPPVSPGRGTFTSSVPDNPTLEWATGLLSETYDNLYSYLSQAQLFSRDAVMQRSRVDTGFMRSNVESFFHATRTQIGLDFGWWDGTPHYAPFQEFGTIHITAMLAVAEVFEAVHSNMMDAVVGR